MVLYSIDDIAKAIGATSDFLLPFKTRRWLKLAFVLLFIVGGFFQFLRPLFSIGSPTFMRVGEQPPIPMLVIGVGIVVILAITFFIASQVMEFVLVNMLRKQHTSVRTPFAEQFSNGIRLLAFRLGLLAVLVVPFGVLWMFTGGVSGNIFVTMILGMLIWIPVAMIFALVNGFTTVFIVPIMLKQDCGIFAAWRELYRSIKSHPTQYGAHIVVGVVYAIGIWIAQSVFSIILVAVPSLIGISGGGFQAESILVGSVIGFTGLVIYLGIRVPLTTAFRYHSMFVLGDISNHLDPVAALRSERDQTTKAEDVTDFEDITGLSPVEARELRDAGYETIDELQKADPADLTEIQWITEKRATEIVREINADGDQYSDTTPDQDPSLRPEEPSEENDSGRSKLRNGLLAVLSGGGMALVSLPITAMLSFALRPQLRLGGSLSPSQVVWLLPIIVGIATALLVYGLLSKWG
jgi:hypothetical protein